MYQSGGAFYAEALADKHCWPHSLNFYNWPSSKAIEHAITSADDLNSQNIEEDCTETLQVEVTTTADDMEEENSSIQNNQQNNKSVGVESGRTAGDRGGKKAARYRTLRV